MWHSLTGSSSTNPDFAGSAHELVQSTMRMLIATIGVAYALWHFVAAATWPIAPGERVWITLLLVAVALGLGLLG